MAELHVAELTGLPTSSAGMALSVDAVGPGAWAWRTVDDWRFLLDAMTLGPPAESDPQDEDAMGDPAGGAEALARLMSTMGPMLAALQLGSAVGHLARGTLGQYEIPVWRPAPGLLMVPANVTSFAEDWSLSSDEVRLWVCLREVTVHAVLGRSHVRDRIATLLTGVVQGMAGDAAGLIDQLQQIDPTDPEALQAVLGDPTALVSAEPSPQRARASEELGALIAALLGYVEHVLDLAATRLLGGRGALAEAWRRRQVDRDSAARTAEMLFGLDLGPAEVERGVRFVSGVLSSAPARKAWRACGPHPRLCPRRPRSTPPGCGSSGSASKTPTRLDALTRHHYAVAGAGVSSSSGMPRSHSSSRYSRSASRTTRSRLRRNCGSWGGSRVKRAMVRSRNGSITVGLTRRSTAPPSEGPPGPGTPPGHALGEAALRSLRRRRPRARILPGLSGCRWAVTCLGVCGQVRSSGQKAAVTVASWKRTGWHPADAGELDPAIFFPSDGIGVQVAQRICAECPVKAPVPRVRPGQPGRPRRVGRHLGA